MDFWCFLAIFELMSDSLTTTQVEPNQCPSHQSILLTQGPIHENFMKKYWELAKLESEVFLSQPFWIFLLHLYENKQPVHMRYHLFLHYGWFLQNLGKDFIRTNMHTTVYSLFWSDDAQKEYSALFKVVVVFFLERSGFIEIKKSHK